MDRPLVRVVEREAVLVDRRGDVGGRPLVAEVDLVATDREVVATEHVGAALHFQNGTHQAI